MAKAEIGLKQVLIGDPAVDGGMSTDLTEVGATVSDTFTVTAEQPQVTDLTIEEQDDPFYSITTPGKRTIAWDSYNVSPASLVKLCGGTATVDASANNVWEAPLSAPEIIVSVKALTKAGGIIEMPKVKLSATPQFNLKKTDAVKVSVTGTVLVPDKANTSPVKYTQKA